jgi:hypothetical protein
MKRKIIRSKRSFLKIITMMGLTLMLKIPILNFKNKKKIHWMMSKNDY